METNEVQYVGFWKRVLAAVTDSFFFQIGSFLLVLALYRSEYLNYIENLMNTVTAIYQPSVNFAEILQAASGSYSPIESALYFWLPALATIFFWITKSATPGLMAIPAQIIEIRTGKKPSALRLILRFIASIILGYLFGLDYLWIVTSKKKQALHDVVTGTAVIYAPNQVKSGEWTKPTPKTLLKYFATVVIASLLNYGLATFLFNEAVQGTPLFLGIIVQSAFHRALNPLLPEILAIGFIVALFAIPALLFRFSLRWLDEWWLVSSALLFTGGLNNIFERIATGGVRNIFFVSDGLRYICVTCGIRFSSYFWNPADFFVSIGIYSLTLILLASRSWLIWKSFQQSAT